MVNSTSYNQLVLDNMGFVVSLAEEYHNKHRQVDLDDLVSEGSLAMLRAARKWDPERGVRFVNYAVRDIRKAMERLLPEEVITTEALPEKLKAGKPHTDDAAEQGDMEASIFPALGFLNEREQFVIESYYGLNVDDRMTMAEIAQEMQVTRSRVRQILKTAQRKMRRILNHNVFI
ncbi:MAG: sigma-70 family RNA polymerase sigma factor [Prevotella sp.]|nr:sigma-70 family RNA polymerase sigma factor [Prevotella sp.]